MEFETKHVIAHDDFTKAAEANLAFALNPENDLVEAMESVKAVTDKLGEIEAGTLEVQPPLSAELVSEYREKAKTITGIGQRAVDALTSTDTERKSRLGAFFQGFGNAAKS